MARNKTRNKSSISKAESYKDIGAFWDTHDLTEHLNGGKDVDIDVDIEMEVTYYALEKSLSERLQKAAKKHGVSSDTLVNMWLQDKLQEEQVF